jgi:hypothetical protein
MTDEVTQKGHRARINAVGAVLIAVVIAGLAGWLLVLPIREPVHLTPIEPRPALLDKPHRQ